MAIVSFSRQWPLILNVMKLAFGDEVAKSKVRSIPKAQS